MNESNNKKRQTQGQFQAYKKTNILTANKQTILLMMYAGAIRFLKQGIRATDEGKHLDRTKYIGKTQQIVSELRSTLNFETGGEIAKNLDSLYAFITDRLIQGSIHKKKQPLEEALNILITLNEAWETAVSSLKNGKTQQAK